jgi:uncharacterized repeat protein (TIGR01451 family)
MKRSTCYQALVLSTALGLVQGNVAHAAGTLANTTVTNNATVNFSVGGVAQTPVSTSVGAGTAAQFVVDRRVNLTVAEDGAVTTSVVPGATAQVTKFILTNTTNDTLDFSLAVAQDAGGTAAHGGTDNFNATNVLVFVDNVSGGGTVGTYDPGIDTLTYVDELGPDTSRAVFVVVDIPGTQVNGDVAGVTLTATAAAGGTAATQGADLTAAASNTAGVDTVFADGAGDTDAANDGKHSDDDDYTVSAATISLVKSSTIISDPVGAAGGPYAIPGAVIEYCIEVSNTGSASATSISLSDTLPAQTTWATGASQNFRVGGAKVAGVCNDAGSVEDDDAAGADESDPNGGNHAAGVVSASIPSVAAGSSTTVKFRVTVN